MAVIARRGGTLRFWPATALGLAALALFALSIVLFAARVVLTPTTGLPLNFLVVFITMGAAGALALVAIGIARERSIASFAVLVVGLLAATVLIAETFGQGSPNGPTLGEAASGKTFKVQKGAQVVVQLPGNPSTGYGWEATISDPSVLRESSSPVFKPASDALGAGGMYTFRYEATAAGRSDLTLVYRRSWETNVPPLKTFKVTIVVP